MGYIRIIYVGINVIIAHHIILKSLYHADR